MTNQTVTTEELSGALTKSGGAKHREVARALRQEIEARVWQHGEQLPGERDLARRFDVSYLTLRQGITNLVQEGILVRIPGKGTFVAQQRAVVAGTPQPMALLLPGDLLRVDPYYFPEVYEGFQQGIEASGRSAALYSYDALETPGALESGTAVACLLFELPNLSIIEGLRDNGYRVLAINHYSGRRSIPSVRVDDAHGVEQAVDHLVALGHERIGFLAGPKANIDAAFRLRGFRAAVRRHGLRYAPEAGDRFTEASGYAAARTLLSAVNRPTAVVCASDLCAIGALKAARDAGLSVPRGLSIVGFGDFSVADYLSPGLTTVRQDRRALGRAAAASLIRLAEDDDPEDVILIPELIVRESVVPNAATPLAAIS